MLAALFSLALLSLAAAQYPGMGGMDGMDFGDYGEGMGGMGGTDGRFPKGHNFGSAGNNFDDFDAKKEKSYEEHVKQWRAQNTKSDFISRVKKEMKDPKMSKGRADRLWTHFNSLLDHGGVRFKEDSYYYYLPLTHHLTFLPDPIAEIIEMVTTWCRAVYYAGLHLIHPEAVTTTHDAFHWFEDSGWSQIVLYVISSFLAFNFLSWLVYRFTDGIFPYERKMNRETRRLAEEYIRSKRSN